jgi:Tryptophan dimethylallyltransferase
MLELDTTGDQVIRSKASVRTLGQQLDSRLARLLAALRQSDHLENSLRTTRLLTRSWRDELVAAGPRWSSDITDDHSPFEFSLSLDGTSEVLRILTEPQDPGQPSLRASWQLAADIHEELAAKGGAGFAGYDKVAQLFAPSETSEGVFSVWHSAILGSAKKTEFKIYLNPAIHGAADAGAVVSEALQRLGLGDAWAALSKAALSRVGLDQVIYFSLDLADTTEARAKVYVAHRHATARDVARALSSCPGFLPSDVGRWCQHLLGNRGPFHDRPPITCFALRRGKLDLYTTTLHLPVRCYAPDDFDIARRVCTLLRFPQRVSYMRALTELAERPLQNGPGLQTYASLRASPGREAVTVYLAPQVYSSAQVRTNELGLGLFGHPDELPSSRPAEYRVAT